MTPKEYDLLSPWESLQGGYSYQQECRGTLQQEVEELRRENQLLRQELIATLLIPRHAPPTTPQEG